MIIGTVWDARLLLFASIVAFVVMAGCGGGGSDNRTPTTIPNAPVISNLAVASSSQACTANGLSGRVRTVGFDYSDPDGNVSGGQVNLSVTSGSQTLATLAVGVPSSTVSVTGTTSGRVTVSNLCIAIVGASSATLNVTLTDALGNVSNQIATTVAAQRPASDPSRPAEAPAGAIGH
jgi:hypothetical protein